MADVNLKLDDVLQLSFDALVSCGASSANAMPVAESIRDAEADGIRNVGLNYLSHYCEHLICGKVDGQVQAGWEQTSLAVLNCDAKQGFAHSAFTAVLTDFVDLARNTGICSLSISNSYAAGVIGWYVEKLSNHGLVALAFANSPPAIAPWGGTCAFFGTNPMAFAIPRPNRNPLVIDQSASTTAKVNVVEAAATGNSIPEDWAFDVHGNPTTDAKAGLQGSMAPAGGYKGVSLAMITDLLAGGLAGPNLSHNAKPFGNNEGGPPGVGQFFIAINPEVYSPSFTERCESMLTAMCQQQGVRLPGERRISHRQSSKKNGVWLPEKTHQKLLDYCAKTP